MISPEHQKKARLLGLAQVGDQSDDDFVKMIIRLWAHRDLVSELKRLGGNVTYAMTSKQLRLAICERQIVVLTEQGFVEGARMFIGVDPERLVEIREIVFDRTGREPKVTVKYWIISPWEKSTNQGRANYYLADEVLKKAKLVPS